jgi:hypothetical protein
MLKVDLCDYDDRGIYDAGYVTRNRVTDNHGQNDVSIEIVLAFLCCLRLIDAIQVAPSYYLLI